LTVLYNFGTPNSDPEHPSRAGFIAQSRDGNLYTTSEDGGTNGAGTVSKVSPAGRITVVYNFNGTEGGLPYGGLTLGTDGNFYGSTTEGGPSTYGTAFKITPKGVLTLLHGFDSSDGSFPWAPLVEGMNGVFYGTTETGGSGNCGTVDSVTAARVFKTLYYFNGTCGCQSAGHKLLETTGISMAQPRKGETSPTPASSSRSHL
jgi:uncharacterized repeat protein (TIGR03803 family)